MVKKVRTARQGLRSINGTSVQWVRMEAQYKDLVSLRQIMLESAPKYNIFLKKPFAVSTDLDLQLRSRHTRNLSTGAGAPITALDSRALLPSPLGLALKTSLQKIRHKAPEDRHHLEPVPRVTRQHNNRVVSAGHEIDRIVRIVRISHPAQMLVDQRPVREPWQDLLQQTADHDLVVGGQEAGVLELVEWH